MNSAPPLDYRAIVIGAGISGLVAAHDLRKAGQAVLVLERGGTPGGCMATVRERGFLREQGPNSFPGSAVDVLALAKELGIDGDIVAKPPEAGARYIYAGGRLLPAPFSPGDLLTTPLLAWRSKWRLLTEVFGRTTPPPEEESFANFVRRKAGDDVLRNLAGPFVTGIYAGDAERLSVQAAFRRMHRYEKEQGSVVRGMLAAAREAKRTPPPVKVPRQALCTFRDGMMALPRALAATLDGAIRYGAAVENLEALPQGFRVTWRSGGEIGQASCEQLILATSAGAAAALTETLRPSLASALRGIRCVGMATVFFGFRSIDVPHPLRGFGFLIPREEGIATLGCIWSSSLYEDRAPAGHVALTCFLGGALHPEWEGRGADEIERRVLADLERLLGIHAPPVYAATTQYPRFFPQYELGHAGRVAAIERELAALPGLHLTGNYLHGIAVPDCVRNARELAAKITGTRGNY